MFAYSLVSTAISDDRTNLRRGVRLLAEIAHTHGIPITWAINRVSARAFAADFTQWHESFGDELLLLLDMKPIWGSDTPIDRPESAEHIVTMREKLPGFISSEWEKVQREMEWASPVAAGAVEKNHVLLYAVGKVGFKGLWGYRWGDKGGDAGCPFGFFYPSTDAHNMGGPAAGKIAGIPAASPSPASVWSVVNQKLPSTQEHESEENDSLDLRAQIVNGTAHHFFNLYAANAAWNPWLAYVQHINADQVAQFSSEHLETLNAYFAHVAQQSDTQAIPLVNAIDDFQRQCNQTPPTFLLIESGDSTANTKADSPTDSGAMPPQSMLFYYDSECQLVFEADSMEPIAVKNYISPPVKSRDGTEFSLPKIEKFLPSRTRSLLRMHFEIESPKSMPYGLAIWGDHAGLTLSKSNTHAVTRLDNRLLFVRVDVQPGKNAVEVVLTI